MGMFESAGRRRRAAEMQRRLAQLDEWDRRYGLGGAPPGHPSARPDTTWRHHSPAGEAPLRALDPSPRPPGHRPVRQRRRTGRWLVLLLVVALGVGAYLYPGSAGVVLDRATAAGRAVLGLPAQEPEALAPAGGRDSRLGDLGDRLQDAVVPALQGTPWGWEPARGDRVLPVVHPGTSGEHAFVATQPGTDVPVGFSPCGPVEVAVNPDRAPRGYTRLVQDSLARLSAASGLQLVLVGETDDTWRGGEARRAGLPVLVSWADADDVPELAGQPAGMGGPTMMTGADDRSWSASGQVVLDVGDLSSPRQHATVLDHELAHVLGLDHVDDPHELMAAVNRGQTGFGPGDLEGLAALGAISCP
ncbi:zinc metalloprotease [Ornithinimicrobium avium]|uniref:Uncharacterized protein n=1 Tax=Ornithinimicrobium avium TaxID=2283195 RepID=A0A345NNG3_9MICO|nr:matrixin family metalloprotease [Ornithinimicrobium avium]AXH96571.1 hypothetical protein DV701_10955 [Ornithinimicrobium avium]